MASEPINIPIKTTYDDEGAKDALQDAEKLEALEPVVKIDVDATEAKDAVEQVSRPLDELIAKNPWIAEVKADIGEAKADLETVQQDLKETGNAAEGAGGHVKNLGGEADNSRSVLANMVGNSAQDIGELGGIAGTAGMAIGQLGEYATEGNIALSGLGKVAGPMLALSAATWALQKGAKQAAAAAKELSEQIDDLSTVSDQAALDSVTSMMLNQIVAGKDLGDIWNKIGENPEGARRLVALARAGGATEESLKGLNEVIRKHDEGMIQGAKTTKEFGDKVADVGESSDKTGEQLLEQSRNTDLTRQATERATKWEEQHARELDAATKASEDLSKATKDYRDAVNGTDWGKTRLAGALAGMEQFTDQHNAMIDLFAESEAAFDGLSESVKENGKSFDVTTEKGRKNQAALEDLAGVLDTQLAAGFAEADGDQTKFTENATKLAQDTLARLQKEMHLSDTATQELGKQLGLLPEDIQTRYELAGDAVALEKLGLLQGAIDALPQDVQTNVTQQIILGDYQGALNTVQTYYTNNPVVINAVVNEAKIKAQLASAQGGIQSWLDRLTMSATSSTGRSAATTVNVNLPRGVRHGDIARALGVSTRRNGRRYGSGSGVVAYARR